jgi:heptosyltransferase-2
MPIKANKKSFTSRGQVRLAIRLPNWLGDTLMTYPLLRALSDEGLEFTCFGHSWVADIFSATNFEMVSDDRVSNKRWLAKQYRQGKFSNVLVCPPSSSALIPPLLAGVPTTGYHPLCAQRVTNEIDLHRVEQYFELGRAFYEKSLVLDRESNFVPLGPEKISEADLLVSEMVDGEFLVVCPYATNRHHGVNKEWPHWREFIEDYKEKKLIGIVAPQDEIRFKKEFPKTDVLSTNLTLAASIMRRAEHVITNDSGAMHLASFFGANVTGLIGVTDFEETQPWFGSYLVNKDETWVSLDKLKTHLAQTGPIAKK